VHVVEKLNPVLKACDQLDADTHDVDAARVAAACGMSRDDVRSLLDLPTTVPLEQILETTAETDLAERSARYREVAAPDLREFDVDDIRLALWSLSDRDRYVLYRRHGFLGDAATLDTIGGELGVTRERIRQIETKAHKRVRRRLWYVRSQDDDR
jgi:DNA-directed RNA polymerase sigma subunit (sigma70/sigma32)